MKWPTLHPADKVTKPILMPISVDRERRDLYKLVARLSGCPNYSKWFRDMADAKCIAFMKNFVPPTPAAVTKPFSINDAVQKANRLKKTTA